MNCSILHILLFTLVALGTFSECRNSTVDSSPENYQDAEIRKIYKILGKEDDYDSYLKIKNSVSKQDSTHASPLFPPRLQERCDAGRDPAGRSRRELARKSMRYVVDGIERIDVDFGESIKTTDPIKYVADAFVLRPGIDDLRQEESQISSKSSGMEFVKYSQFYKGIPVLRGGYTVTKCLPAGYVLKIWGGIIPNINADINPKIDEEAAYSIILKEFGTTFLVHNLKKTRDRGVLSILKTDHNPSGFLVWHYHFTHIWDIVSVSAQDGKIIYKHSDMHIEK